MVPTAKILQEAKDQKVDIIGLSGLITPSLDEMQHVAAEMSRLELDLPLLIGGATTSRAHTAVKINPKYDKGVVYVTDASRAVGVVGDLLSKERKGPYLDNLATDYEKIRTSYLNKQKADDRVPIIKARQNSVGLNWSSYTPPAPNFIGTKSFDDYDLGTLVPYIDWSPFFATWELAGRYPAILEDKVVGEAAKPLFDDAQVMLEKIVKEKWFKASGVIGFWPATSIDDDIQLYTDETRTTTTGQFFGLRQQMTKKSGQPNYCLSDYIAPKSADKKDWLGGFAVTTGHGEGDVTKRFEREADNYSAIMASALADRLAEAFAEHLHERVRREFWGYGKQEGLSKQDLIAEKYAGIRPAPGYPAQPDHTEKALLFKLLQAERQAGIKLTESYAMMPGAAVSGLYFSHPDSVYFGVGKIGRDQVKDYATRKGMKMTEAERWLAPILGYAS